MRSTGRAWITTSVVALLGSAAGWICFPRSTPEPGSSVIYPTAVELPDEPEAEVPSPQTLDQLWDMTRQIGESGSLAPLLREIDKIATIDGVQAMVDEGLARMKRWQTDPDQLPAEEDGEALYVVWKVLVARFAEMDAKRAFAHGMQIAGEDGALPQVVFFELVKQHPEMIEEFAADLKVTNFRSSLKSLLSVAYLLADSDPSLALRLYEHLEPGNEYMTYSFFVRWAQSAPEEVIQRAATLTKLQRRYALQATAQVWAQDDTRAALKWAKGEDPKNVDGILGKVIGVISLHDPTKAAELALELAADDPAVLSEVSRQWLSRDLDGAFAWILSLNDPVLQQHMLAIREGIFERDPEKPIAWLNQFPLNQSLAVAYANLMEQLAKTNLDVAVEWLKTSGNVEALDIARSKVVYRWADKDPVAAADYAAENPHLITDDALEYLTRHLALQDPARAFEWASQLASDEIRRDATQVVMGVATAGDPQEALPLALALEPGKTRSVTLQNLIHNMIQASRPGEAGEWLQSLPEKEQRELAPMVLARIDPAEIGSLLQNQALYDASGRALTAEAKKSLTEMAQMLVQSTNAEAALEWASTLPAAASLASATSIIRQWSNEDAAAAAEFVSVLPVGELQQAATAAMTPTMAHVDPESAWRWALTVEDPEIRYKVVSEVVETWNAIDSVAARTALAKAPVNNEQRERIENRLRSVWEE
ncbi:MAG: hypothetical protein KDN22_02820 [Verrucomicrobiae bacterium]|nr:hypothetical protein [Verrucomicrobiae bacterium]